MGMAMTGKKKGGKKISGHAGRYENLSVGAKKRGECGDGAVRSALF